MTPYHLLIATALTAGVFGATAAVAAPLAYASNEGSASVSVIDTSTDKVVATLKFGDKPRGIALSAGGQTSGANLSVAVGGVYPTTLVVAGGITFE